MFLYSQTPTTPTTTTTTTPTIPTTPTPTTAAMILGRWTLGFYLLKPKPEWELVFF